MRLDSFVKLKYQLNTVKYYPSVLNILCVTYFLASITMPDPQTSDVRHICGKWCQRSPGISSP